MGTDISITPANCNRQAKVYLPSAQVSKLVTQLLQWSSFLFEAIFSLIILSHVKTSNVKGSDHQIKKLSIVKQILLVSILGNV